MEVAAPTMKVRVEKAPADRQRGRAGEGRRGAAREGGARLVGGRRRQQAEREWRQANCRPRRAISCQEDSQAWRLFAMGLRRSPQFELRRRHAGVLFGDVRGGASGRTVVDRGGAEHALVILLPLGLKAVLGAEQQEDEDREGGLQGGTSGGAGSVRSAAVPARGRAGGRGMHAIRRSIARPQCPCSP